MGRDTTKDGGDVIAVEGLTFGYGTGTQVLAGLDLSVAPGEVFGLLGPSGSGKSTTQKILMGLLTGYGGQVRVLGAAPGAGGRRFYERIGVSFELPALYLRLTARENLRLFASLYKRDTLPPSEALEAVGLLADADKRVAHFSKGMKMRLNLARALLHRPDLLFLDEPTAGQDPARARQTRALISGLKAEGRTVFLTTHNMAEAAAICDRVAFLVDGRAAAEGPPAELERRYGRAELDVRADDGAGGSVMHRFAMADLATNADFLALLQEGRILAMHTREASLDDVFVAVAGEADR